jgi:hypothetical protein
MQGRVAAKCPKSRAVVLPQGGLERLRRPPCKRHPRWVAQHQVEARLAAQLVQVRSDTAEPLRGSGRAQRIAFTKPGAGCLQAQRGVAREQPQRNLGDGHRQRADIDAEQLVANDERQRAPGAPRGLAPRLHQERARAEGGVQDAQSARRKAPRQRGLQRLHRSLDDDARQRLRRVVAAGALAQAVLAIAGARRQQRLVQLTEGFYR